LGKSEFGAVYSLPSAQRADFLPCGAIDLSESSVFATGSPVGGRV